MLKLPSQWWLLPLHAIMREEDIVEHLATRPTPDISDFDLDEHIDEARKMLDTVPKLNEWRFRLVPSRLKELHFWAALFDMLLLEYVSPVALSRSLSVQALPRQYFAHVTMSRAQNKAHPLESSRGVVQIDLPMDNEVEYDGNSAPAPMQTQQTQSQPVAEAQEPGMFSSADIRALLAEQRKLFQTLYQHEETIDRLRDALRAAGAEEPVVESVSVSEDGPGKSRRRRVERDPEQVCARCSGAVGEVDTAGATGQAAAAVVAAAVVDREAEDQTSAPPAYGPDKHKGAWKLDKVRRSLRVEPVPLARWYLWLFFLT